MLDAGEQILYRLNRSPVQFVIRDGGRAVDLGGPKFEIKHKSCCFQDYILPFVVVDREGLLIEGARLPPWRRPCL